MKNIIKNAVIISILIILIVSVSQLLFDANTTYPIGDPASQTISIVIIAFVLSALITTLIMFVGHIEITKIQTQSNKPKLQEFDYKDAMKELQEEIKREESSFPYRMYKKLYRFIWNGFYLGDLKRDIVAFIQRGKRGWANRDVWGFGAYLSQILKDGLYHLKENKCGYPGNMTEGQWVDALNKMIDTFQLAYEIYNGDVFYMSTKEWNEETYLKMLTYTKEKDSGMKKVVSKKEAREFEEGFKLFQTHFFSLWD